MSSQPTRRGLGRGLGALIPTSDPDAAEDPAAAPPAGSGEVAGHATGPAGGVGATRSFTGNQPPGTENHAAGPDPGEEADPADPADPAGAGQDGLAEPGARFAEVPLDQVTPNPRQPRQVFDEEAMAELVHSVREIGLLQPVVVRATGPAAYELVMGERRWRACQEAGLVTVPAIVRETDDGDLLRDALLENLHRAELNPLEEASAYAQLLEDFDCTHDELARRLGRSRPQISNLLRLLRLSPAVQRRVAAGVLSGGHARALLAVTDPDQQDHLAGRVVAEGISVRGLEEIVQVGEGGRRSSGGGSRPRSTPPADSGADEVAARLSDRLETRVKVDLGKRKGRITVEFASREDLHRITGLIDPGGDSGMSL